MSLKIIYLVMFLDTIGMGFLIPLVNPRVISLGGSLSLVGIVNSLTSGAQLFASPVIGSWSDTRGRKLLLVTTLCIVCVSNILAGFSSLPMFFLARILYGIAHQTDSLLKVLIADVIPENELTGAFNKLMAMVGLAFIFGPVLGGMLFEYFGNFFYINIILFILDILTIGTTINFIEEKPKKDKGSKKEPNKTFMQNIYADLSKVFADLGNVNWSKYGDILFIKFLFESAFSLVFMNMGVILMRKFLFTQTHLGLSIAFISTTMIVSTFIASFVIEKIYKTDKSGHQRILHGFIALILSFCVMFFTTTATYYLSVFVPLLAAKSLLDSTWMQILSRRTTESDKGIMMGAATSMLSLSGLICPLVGGIVGDFVGISALTALPLIPAIAGTILSRKVKYNVIVDDDKKDS